MVRNLKWLGAAFEAFLGIPALGGLFIISMGYTPLGFMLVCVMVSQLLLYRLSDGSYEAAVVARRGSSSSTTTNDDHDHSAMGLLVTDYGLEFAVSLSSFGLGVATLILATEVSKVVVSEIAAAVDQHVLVQVVS